MKNGETIYLSVRTEESNIENPTYGTPTAYVLQNNYLTVQPASGYLDTLTYGERIHRYWNGVANYDVFNGIFNEGDLAYIDGATPTGETYNGENANARVRSVLSQNKAIRIVFEKLI